MKCDNCKQNEANFHSITNINGKVTEKHLCLNCSKNNKDFEDFKNNAINNFFSNFETNFSYFSNPFIDFYNNFENDIMFLENNKDCGKIKEETNKKQQLQLEINKTDIMLKKAVVEERYEDAIVLRDKLKKLKEQL